MVSNRGGRIRLYWDACVWLSYINEHTDRVEVLEFLLRDSASSAGDREIITSVIAQAEVAFGILEQTKGELITEVEQRIDSLWNDRRAITPVEIYPQIALDARELVRTSMARGWSLKPLDAIHLATAQSWHVDEFHTYDKKLLRYGSELGFLICEPYVPGGLPAQPGVQTDMFDKPPDK